MTSCFTENHSIVWKAFGKLCSPILNFFPDQISGVGSFINVIVKLLIMEIASLLLFKKIGAISLILCGLFFFVKGYSFFSCLAIFIVVALLVSGFGALKDKILKDQ